MSRPVSRLQTLSVLNFLPRLEVLEDRSMPDATGWESVIAHPNSYQQDVLAEVHGYKSPVGLTPAQIRSAYGFDSIRFGSIVGDGAGQTIAIISAYDNPKFVSSTASGYAQSDLMQFAKAFGLPGPASFTKVNQNGGNTYSTPVAGWAQETALDVQWAHALAPKASILLVQAFSNKMSDLTTAVNYAKNQPGVSVVSMSFGTPEFSGQGYYDSAFLAPSGKGVTFVASTGDAGAPGEYPAYSPNVVAVGGTKLNMTLGGSYSTETGWAGSGGGISKYATKPGYQNTVTLSSTMRTIPDVSFNADPASGVAVYDSYNNGTANPWVNLGGTSFSAPAWGALVAIANQGRAISGKASLNGVSQTLPMLYQASNTAFLDVTSGSNGYSAAAGYDLVTGRGSPKAAVMASYLSGVSAGTTPPPNPTPWAPTPSTGFTLYSGTGGSKAVGDLKTVSWPITINDSLTLSQLKINLDVTHTRVSDLSVYLIGPDGTRVNLITKRGGTGQNLTKTELDSTSTKTLVSASAPFTGSFQPEQSLAILNGKNIKGTWTLYVSDSVSSNAGTINGWWMQVKGTATSTTTTRRTRWSAVGADSVSTQWVDAFWLSKMKFEVSPIQVSSVSPKQMETVKPPTIEVRSTFPETKQPEVASPLKKTMIELLLSKPLNRNISGV